jgi:hypothetical protein
MLPPDKVQEIYEELAERSHRNGDARQRDICLALAADTALANGRFSEAERLRRRLLEYSPHNLLSPFGSFNEAMLSRDIRDYLADLRRQFPPEKAERVMASLGPEVSETLDSPFGKEVYALHPSSAPAPPKIAVPPSARPAAPSPPAAPAKQARRSPYESPDYGPRVGDETAPAEFAGTSIIFLLAVLVGLLALALLGYALGRPFLHL